VPPPHSNGWSWNNSGLKQNDSGKNSLRTFCDRKALIQTSCRNDGDTAEAIAFLPLNR